MILIGYIATQIQQTLSLFNTVKEMLATANEIPENLFH
jgi:hypothetical protein